MEKIALYTTSGLIQYAESEAAMLAEYNRHGNMYEVRTNADGQRVLWHKGDARAVGVFRAALGGQA